MKGSLFVVATPIGNLADISARAIETLKAVSLIAVEDTRHSVRLMQEYGISTPMQACHEFNEKQRAESFIRRIEAGENIALISDAGTPLISDPGYQLVRLAHENGVKVVPLPGPSALIAALSAAGLASDRFTFEGFLPAKQQGRLNRLQALSREERTMIFYEAPHRILECLDNMLKVFGVDREITLARELTKSFETIVKATVAELLEFVKQDVNQQRGEIVLVLAGYKSIAGEADQAAISLLEELLGELPLKKAAALCARITGFRKSDLYQAGLALQGKKD